ncbi:MAG TPA: aminotransferase class V-fold PLP-dependent enzyme [Ramlibacter sp.]|uniref:aminotransferase class V-fold PLP-dependent enzyme n=1 Tax=Ramlibacter sp. TaxID=1917967 RepID=UPI002ED09075
MAQTTIDRGEAFPPELSLQIKERFHHVDHDFTGRKRLYFENAGGSLRLKAVLETMAKVDAIPDSAERIHEAASWLKDVQTQGVDDVRLLLNAKGGTVHASLTASGAMFEMVRAVAENVPGDNIVTTTLEHPSSYDSAAQYAQRLGKELRVARSNAATGGIDVEEIARLVDERTCLLVLIYASNISGAKLDLEQVVRRAREIKPDLYILVDAVQHAPHGLVDLQKTPVDGINIAPYKFFGCRGSGFSWLSERAAALPHHKLAGKPAGFWDLGSAAPWQFAAVTEIVNYVCWIGGQFGTGGDRRALFVRGMERIGLHERALLARLLEGSNGVPGLRRIPGVTVLLDHDDLPRRDLILAISLRGLEYTQAVREYEQRGVIVYERVASSIYSRRMLESFGLEGAVRISPLHCHTYEDVDRFLEVTREISEAVGA